MNSVLAWWGPLVLALAQGADPALQVRPDPTPRGTANDHREHVLSVARRIIGASRYCTFVTLGRSQGPEARIVDPTPPDASFLIYVATNSRSRKVGEIRRDPRVTLLYFDPAALAYATVIGRATEVKGTLKTAHYKDEWRGFFDRDQPGTYTLYRIVPSRVEVVSPKDGLSGDPATWRPEIVDFK